MTRSVTATVDLAALRHNFSLARQLAGRCKVMAVIKANAYGHGAVPVARALTDADSFGVACLEEALELRRAGICCPVLVLGGVYYGDELAQLAADNLDTVIHSEDQLNLLVSTRLTRPVNVWLKVDTGMHRLGIAADSLAAQFRRLSGHDNVAELRLMTHFASADELDSDCSRRQIELFRAAVAGLPGQTSLANSAALMSLPESHGDWVRPGIMLYGASPFEESHPLASRLQPVMTLEAKIIDIRQIAAGEAVGYGQTWRAERAATIATVAVGYADGYPRGASNGAPVAVNGRRCPVVGRVSMDMLTVDVTAVDGVKPGDGVELWGRQICVNEVARHAGTIGYELLTGLTRRVTYRFSE